MCVCVRRVIWYRGIHIYIYMYAMQSGIQALVCQCTSDTSPFPENCNFQNYCFYCFIIPLYHFYFALLYLLLLCYCVSCCSHHILARYIQTRSTLTISFWTARDRLGCPYAGTAHNADRHWTLTHGLVRFMIKIMSITLCVLL